jgi:hypothetical protein
MQLHIASCCNALVDRRDLELILAHTSPISDKVTSKYNLGSISEMLGNKEVLQGPRGAQDLGTNTSRNPVGSISASRTHL